MPDILVCVNYYLFNPYSEAGCHLLVYHREDESIDYLIHY
jgi:hypothetical protein